MRNFLARFNPASVVMVAVCVVAISTMLSALAYLRLNSIADSNHCLLARVAYYTGDGDGARLATDNYNRFLRGEIKSLPDPTPFPKELCK